jgi:hypothetical protein
MRSRVALSGSTLVTAFMDSIVDAEDAGRAAAQEF